MSFNSSQRLTLVLGIYRSGTSVLAKGMEVLGLSLVEFSETFCDCFNQKGYWEDLEFHQFNVDLLGLLSSLGERRRNILPITEEESEFLCSKGYLAQAILLLQTKMNLYQSLILKDPKFSITLPFWKKAFEVCHLTPSYAITLRSPESVVESMSACEVLFGNEVKEKLWWLWISYLLSILRHTEGSSRIIVAYEDLLKDPSHQIGRIANTLKLSIEEEPLRSYQHEFVDASLLHFPSQEHLSSSFSLVEQFAYKIYQTLLNIARDTIPFCSLPPLLKEWEKTFSSFHSLLTLAEKNEYLLHQCKETLQEQSHSIGELNKTIREKLNTIAQLYRTIHQQNLGYQQ